MNSFDKLILLELFDRSYPLIKLVGIARGGRAMVFKNINQIFSYHLKNGDNNPIFYIKGYFLNKENDNIEFTIHPTSVGGTIFDEDVNEIYTVIFGSTEDKSKLKMNSFDAAIVTSTVMKNVLNFLISLKKVVNMTTKDWENRIENGILRFDPYPNITMNPKSKQMRSDKETLRGVSQRANLYISAFDKIIKPIFPELSVHKLENYYIIKK